jgi:hypothetical protein
MSDICFDDFDYDREDGINGNNFCLWDDDD